MPKFNERGKMSYRKRLQKDLEMCQTAGNMTDIVEIILDKIEKYKEYQRNYYHRKLADATNKKVK